MSYTEYRQPNKHEVIEQRLEKTCRQVKSMEIFLTLTVLITCGLGYLTLFALLDHWGFQGGVPGTLRLILFIGGLLAAGIYLLYRFLPLILYSVNPIYAAKILEEHRPTMKNSLINWIFLRRDVKEHPSGATQNLYQSRMIEGVAKQTANDLEHIPSEMVVDHSPIIRWGFVLVAFVAFLCLYAILSPKNPLPSFARLMFPFSKISAPTRVRFLEIAPGDTTIAQGETITVSAHIDGARKTPVYLYYTTDDQRMVDQIVPMSIPEGDFRYECRFPPGKMGFEQGISYYIGVGSEKSKTFRFDVQQPFLLEVRSLTCKYPAYTGVPDTVVQGTGDIRAVEGTQVVIHAKSNFPLKNALFVPNGEESEGKSLTVPSSEPTTANIAIWLAASATNPLKPEYQSYVLRGYDSQGNTNRNPSVYRVEMLKDQPPKISWIDPPQDQLSIPQNGYTEALISAEDADFGIRKLRVHFDKENQKIAPIELLKTPDQGPTEFTGKVNRSFKIQPDQLRLDVGDVVEYWAEAIDTKLPQGNSAFTQRLSFVVAPPKPGADQKDANEERQEQKEKEQQQEKQEQEKQEQEQGQQDESQSENDENSEESGNSDSDQQKRSEKDEGKDNSDENGDSDDKNQNEKDGKDGENKEKGENGQPDPQNQQQQQQQENQGDQQNQQGEQNQEQQGGAQDQQGGENNQNGTGSQQDQQQNQQGGNGQQDQQQQGGSGQSQKSDDQSGSDSDAAGNSGAPQDGSQENSGDSANGAGTPESGPTSGQENQSGQAGNQGDQKGNAQGNQPQNQQRQSAGKSEPQQPLDGESQPGDVFEKVIEQMKKEGKETDPNKAQRQHSDDLDPNSDQRTDQGTPPKDVPQKSTDKKPGEKVQQAYKTADDQNVEPTKKADPDKPILNDPKKNPTGQPSDEPGQDSGLSGKQPGGEQQPGGEESDSDGDQSGAGEQSGGGEQAGGGQQSGGGEQAGGGEQSGGGEQAGGGQQSGGGEQAGGGQQSGGGEQAGGGNASGENQNGDGLGGSGNQSQSGGETDPGTQYDPNLDFAEKQTSLALKYLEEEMAKSEPNPELLKELGWSKENLKDFLEKWKLMSAGAQKATPGSQEDQKWKEALKSLGTVVPNRSTSAKARTTNQDQATATGALRVQPPKKFQERFKSYNQTISK